MTAFQKIASGAFAAGTRLDTRDRFGNPARGTILGTALKMETGRMGRYQRYILQATMKLDNGETITREV